MALRMIDYYCSTCEHVSRDNLLHTPIPETTACPCGETAKRLAGFARIQVGVSEMSEAKDIWEGFPGLEDTDGINQTHYQSKKSFF